MLKKFVNLYPVWIILSSLIGFVYPPLFIWFTGNWMVIALALVMLGMGVSLNLNDFKKIVLMPGAVFIGILLQYTLMPLSGWGIGQFLSLETELAVGLIIVSCCPGGTASNVIAYLAKANVALSIILTTVSTIMAIIATPLLCQLLAGAYVPVDALGLFFTTIKVVLLPVALGVILNNRFPKATTKFAHWGPVLSVLAIVFIAGSIVAQSAEAIAANAVTLFTAVTLLHSFGFLLGYFITKTAGYPIEISRTVSIEVGMQNGGLAAVLAKQNFPMYPMTAVPAVFSSVIQTLLGGIIAAVWRDDSSKMDKVNNNLAKDYSFPIIKNQLNKINDNMPHRKKIYYWKCDRPLAFHGINDENNFKTPFENEDLLEKLLENIFKSKEFTLRSAGGQGNHITYLAKHKNTNFFVRLETGSEKDDYMEVEAKIMNSIRELGVPTSKILHFDATYQNFPFAYQIMDYIKFPDLNSLYKQNQLDLMRCAYEIGKNVASWQSIIPIGFGPFDTQHLRKSGTFKGFHNNYIDYYYLNLKKHLNFLLFNNFLNAQESEDLFEIIEINKRYLDIKEGCLVHKDLALWNILGDDKGIRAFIDWDDAISGDPTDDLSLLACFHPQVMVEEALRGYLTVKELPSDFYSRFYLHLLRNMIVKAVIRVGANYFNKTDEFFLIESGSKGKTLEEITRQKIFHAYNMLRNKNEEIIL